MKCEACGQEVRPAGASAERVYVKIGAKDTFTAVCRTLRDMTADQKFKDALYDFPKTVEKYGQLTEGQWKFWAVIHNACTGNWPSRGDFLVETPPPTFSADVVDDSSEIPF